MKIEAHHDLSPASFRDPAGCVVYQDGVLKRLVTAAGIGDYRRLMSSGLYERLIGEGLLIPHREEAASRSWPDGAQSVLLPEVVPYISYPYEWSFGQLRDAALLTLRVAELALAHGMSLKDASAFNVQFRGCRPVFIDTLSFERNDGGPWPAYNQFCRHFLAPLLLMKYAWPGLAPFWRASLDGFPLEFASALLPASTYLRFGSLLHIHMHARSQRKHATPAAGRRESAAQPPRGRDSKGPLIGSLRATVQNIEPRALKTEWSDYYGEADHYSKDASEAKRAGVAEVVGRLKPRLVYDLGGNTGEFSRLVTSLGADCVCFDMDPLCVHANYERSRREGDIHMLPLVMDLSNPTPGLGFDLRERLSLFERPQAELLLALALIHHLRITCNVPFRRIAAFLARLGSRLLLEWVPRDDPKVRAMLSYRRDTFPDYSQEGFLAAFGEHFEMEQAHAIAGSSRTLYLFRRRP
jgi:hypothetical protein